MAGQDNNDEAFKAFQNGQFDMCIELLKRNEGIDEWENRRQELNKITAKMARGGWKDVAQYYSHEIRAIFPKLRTTSNIANSCHLSHSTEAFAAYNLSVLAFHIGQYRSAVNLIDCALSADCLPEHTVRCAKLLKIEIALVLNEASCALKLIDNAKNSSNEWSENDQVELDLAEARTCLQMKRSHECSNLVATQKPWRAALCRSHSALLRIDPQTALSELISASNQYPRRWTMTAAGECRQLIVDNDMGIIYAVLLRKPHLAFGYFRSALACMSASGDGDGIVNLSVLSRLAVCYNIGLSLLQTGHSQCAFDCFLTVLQSCHSNPRLWLRLAECCIVAHKKVLVQGTLTTDLPLTFWTNKSSFDLPNRANELVSQFVGVGPHRKLVLQVQFDGKSASQTDHHTDGGAIPMLSLDFASFCLRNALTLTPIITEEQLEREKNAQSGRIAIISALPGPALSTAETYRLRSVEMNACYCRLCTVVSSSILTASAYISLCTGECERALLLSDQLLSRPHLSSAHQLLALLYQCEVLLALDRIPEAILTLRSDFDCDLAPSDLWTSSETVSDGCHWFPNSTASAKSILIYNKALLATLSGQHERAARILQELDSSPDMVVPIEGIVLGIYLQLHLGNVEQAKHMIDERVRGF